MSPRASSANAVADRDAALPSGWRLLSLAETDSTIDELVRRRDSDAGEGVAVMAERQFSGRGRRGRVWQSPSGNLSLSVRLRQAETLTATAQLSFVAALGMAEALEALVPGLFIKMKWPNDLLVDGAKLAGILLETDAPWVIVGIGVNLAAFPPPEETSYPATSVLKQSGMLLRPEELARSFLTQLARNVADWRGRGGFAAVRERWLARACGLGRRVSVALGEHERFEGVFSDLDHDGALILRVGDEIRRIVAGDVYFSRQTR